MPRHKKKRALIAKKQESFDKKSEKERAPCRNTEENENLHDLQRFTKEITAENKIFLDAIDSDAIITYLFYMILYEKLLLSGKLDSKQIIAVASHQERIQNIVNKNTNNLTKKMEFFIHEPMIPQKKITYLEGIQKGLFLKKFAQIAISIDPQSFIILARDLLPLSTVLPSIKKEYQSVTEKFLQLCNKIISKQNLFEVYLYDTCNITNESEKNPYTFLQKIYDEMIAMINDMVKNHNPKKIFLPILEAESRLALITAISLENTESLMESFLLSKLKIIAKNLIKAFCRMIKIPIQKFETVRYISIFSKKEIPNILALLIMGGVSGYGMWKGIKFFSKKIITRTAPGKEIKKIPENNKKGLGN